MRVYSHLLSKLHFVGATFDILRRLKNSTIFNPFWSGKKNDDFNSTCKRGLKLAIFAAIDMMYFSVLIPVVATPLSQSQTNPCSWICHMSYNLAILFTGHKRSSRGGGGSVYWGLCAGGCLSRGVCLGKCLSRRVAVEEGGAVCQRDPPTVKSGRYASYWNAFLCKLSSC